MSTPEAGPALVAREDAETIATGDVSVRLFIDSGATDGALNTVEVRLGPGVDGAAPHFHCRSSELFYLVEGELQVMTGDDIVTVGEGGTLVVPKRMPHAFGATPDSAARVLIVLTPGVERFEYFRLLGRIAEGTATYAELAASQDVYDNHFVDAPRWHAERAAQKR